MQYTSNVYIYNKGRAVCIMAKDYNMDKIKGMLQDEHIYWEIKQDKIWSTMSKINGLINQHDQCLTDKEKDYLTNIETRVSN